MRAKIVFLLPLQRFTGVEEAEFELAGGATVHDLLVEVGRSWGRAFPPDVWSQDSQAFSPACRLLSNRQTFGASYLEAPLDEGEVITVTIPLSGG